MLTFSSSTTCQAGLDITKKTFDTMHMDFLDSTCQTQYWNGVSYGNVFEVFNDSSLKYNNVVYGQLYSNDSLHIDFIVGGSFPYSISYQMIKVKSYFAGCGMTNQSSTISCSSNYSSINFTVDAGAAMPISYTVQPPASCAGSYIVSSSSTNPSFTLNCAGVNTIVVRDANNLLLGTFTHTVNACVGIHELEEISIKIYPIPASDKLIIQNIDNLKTKKCVLVNVDGKELPIQISNVEINISSLAEGIYFLKLETDKGILTRKIIIQR